MCRKYVLYQAPGCEYEIVLTEFQDADGAASHGEGAVQQLPGGLASRRLFSGMFREGQVLWAMIIDYTASGPVIHAGLHGAAGRAPSAYKGIVKLPYRVLADPSIRDFMCFNVHTTE